MQILQKDLLENLNMKVDTVILLDCEGLGSFTRNSMFDMQIFCILTLLSSTLVYNSIGTIDDSALESISYPFLIAFNYLRSLLILLAIFKKEIPIICSSLVFSLNLYGYSGIFLSIFEWAIKISLQMNILKGFFSHCQ